MRSGSTDRWWTFDARNNQPRIGRVLMATGRDASDVAMTTSFGQADLRYFFVVTEEEIPAPLSPQAEQELDPHIRNSLLRVAAGRIVAFARDHLQVVLVGLEGDLVEAAVVVNLVRRVGQQILAAQLLGDQAVDFVQIVFLLGFEEAAAGARRRSLSMIFLPSWPLALVLSGPRRPPPPG